MNTETALAAAPESTELVSAIAPVVSIQQHEAFYQLPEKERERVQILLRACSSIAASNLGTVAAIRLMAPGLGMSYGNLRELYYAYKNLKDWRVFVRRWGGAAATPNAFQQEVKRRMELNSRSMLQAIQSIKDDFRTGKEIPGYGTWTMWYRAEYPTLDLPAALPHGVWPRGWSKSQLYLKAPTKAERALKARGWLAAKRYLPHVVRDMSGLRFLELIVIDDFETDIIVLARNPASGRYELVVCKGLLAIDGATRTILAWALKPKFGKTEQEQEESGSKRHGITQDDVKQLLYSVFSGHGLPADYGVTILCENAAASISGDFELELESLFGVQVARTGLMAKEIKTLRNGFAQSGGKPYEKGWIESTFNIAWNIAATMPGQKGASYQLKPGDHTAKLLHAQKLVTIVGLSDAQIAELKMDFFREEEALQGFGLVFDALDRRTQHHLQGFEEIVNFRLPDGSDVLTREALGLRGMSGAEVMACEPVVRMESPLERKARITRGVRFVKVAEQALALLLLTPKRCVLRNYKVTFEHAGRGFVFFDADSPVLTLPDGTELIGYLDGLDSNVLYCTRLDGSFIGALKRKGAVDIRNPTAIKERSGEVARLIMKNVLGPQRERHEGENTALVANDAHNLAILRSAGIAEKCIPARLLPPANRSALGVLSDATHQTSNPSGAEAEPGHPGANRGNVAGKVGNNGQDSRPAATISCQSLSAKLARSAPASEAVAARGEALTRGIAEQTLLDGAARHEARSLSTADDLDCTALL